MPPGKQQIVATASPRLPAASQQRAARPPQALQQLQQLAALQPRRFGCPFLLRARQQQVLPQQVAIQHPLLLQRQRLAEAAAAMGAGCEGRVAPPAQTGSAAVARVLRVRGLSDKSELPGTCYRYPQRNAKPTCEPQALSPAAPNLAAHPPPPTGKPLG